jgi:hypothetical protein
MPVIGIGKRRSQGLPVGKNKSSFESVSKKMFTPYLQPEEVADTTVAAEQAPVGVCRALFVL